MQIKISYACSGLMAARGKNGCRACKIFYAPDIIEAAENLQSTATGNFSSELKEKRLIEKREKKSFDSHARNNRAIE